MSTDTLKVEEVSGYISNNFSDLRIPAVVVKKLKENGIDMPDSFQTLVIEKLSSKFNLFASTPERVDSNCYTIAIGLIKKAEKRFENSQSMCIVPTTYYAQKLINTVIAIKPDVLTVLNVQDPALITEKVQEHIVVGTPELFSQIIDRKLIDLDHIHQCIVYNTYEMLVDGSEGSHLRLLNVLKKFTSKRYAFFSPEITAPFETIFREIGITEIKKVSGTHIEPLNVMHYGVSCNVPEEKPPALLGVVRKMADKQGLLFTASPQMGDAIAGYFSSRGVPAKNIASDSVTDASAAEIRNDFNSLGVQIIVCTYDRMYRLEGILGVAIAINFDTPRGYLEYGRVTGRITRFSPYGVIVNIMLASEKRKISSIMAKLGCVMNYVTPEEVVLPISLADPQARVSKICDLIRKTI